MTPAFALQQILPSGMLRVCAITDVYYDPWHWRSGSERALARQNCRPERLYVDLDSPTANEPRQCETAHGLKQVSPPEQEDIFVGSFRCKSFLSRYTTTGQSRKFNCLDDAGDVVCG